MGKERDRVGEGRVECFGEWEGEVIDEEGFEGMVIRGGRVVVNRDDLEVEEEGEDCMGKVKALTVSSSTGKEKVDVDPNPGAESVHSATFSSSSFFCFSSLPIS